MHEERRDSLRVHTSVRCAWRVYDALPDRPALIRDFSLHGTGVSVERVLAIDHQLQALLGDASLGAGVREALMLMNDKIDAVAHESLFALPEPVLLELAMGGVRLPEPVALQDHQAVGLHLVLHDQHCFLTALPCEVSGTDDCRLRFETLPAHEQRRLNRFLLLESRASGVAIAATA